MRAPATTFALIIILVLSTAPAGAYSSISNTLSQSEPYPIQRDWTVNIVVVNYDETFIDENVLVENLPLKRSYITEFAEVIYNIEYDVKFVNMSYTENLRQLVIDNSISGDEQGTILDETALEYHKNHLDEPQRIFYSRAGMEIDAYVLEDWLIANPAVEPPNPGFTLYLLNFSEFDSSDHEFEHWYNYHPIDPDTGETQDWFRLEWDNELNPNVKLQYPGFGGRGNIYVLDPSADQWYLRWARIWWGNPPYTNDFEHCTMDLEDKLATIDPSTPGGKQALNVYLRDYIYDPISFLFMPGQHYPTTYVTEGNLRALVFCMDVANGVPISSLQWVTDANMQKAHLEELIPFFPWTVTVDYRDIDNYPDWSELFWRNAEIYDGITVVNGYEMFYDIYDNQRQFYVDDSNEMVSVFSVVFIKKQMEMHASGRTFTGLGGGGQTVVWKTWERYYRPDGVTPKDGVSSVQLHETMHAIGFLHTWITHHYVGDFGYSPMGYFSFHNGTSTFDQNWAQCTYLDQMEGELRLNFTELSDQLGDNERPETYTAQMQVEAEFERARFLYNRMDWIGCFDALMSAAEWMEIMMNSRTDFEPPIIDWWTVPEEVTFDGFIAWANVTDVGTGVRNVSVHVNVDNTTEYVFDCEQSGQFWTAAVPAISATSHLTIWVEASDSAMNIGVSQAIALIKEHQANGAFNLLGPAIGWIITGVVVIATVFLVRKFSFRTFT